MEVIQILEKLVAFNTVEDKENKEIVEFIKAFLGEYSYECKTIINKNTNKKCLIAKIGENPVIGFSGHLDTVKVAEGWETDPFKLEIKNEKIYGLGVCDMKGGIAAFLKACTQIDKEKLKKGIMLIFTYDEEIGFEGIRLLQNEKIKFPQNLILAEPTNLEPVIATKGCLEIEVKFKGKSTHSSTPNKGKNAIISACNCIEDLMLFAEDLKKSINRLFSIPYTTINIGTIVGGDAINKVPDKCVVALDARTVNKKDNDKAVEKIEELSNTYDFTYKVLTNILPNINENEGLILDIEQLSGKERTSENYVTEASFLEDVNSIILGPGPITAHQANECIDIKGLNKLVDIYKEVIEKYCY